MAVFLCKAIGRCYNRTCMGLNPKGSLSRIKETASDIQERVEGFLEEEGLSYDSEGLYHMRCDLRQGEVFLPYSGGLSLEKGLFDYIEEGYGFAIRPKKVALDFYIDEEFLPQKDRVRRAYRRHYEGAILETRHNRFRNRIVVLILFLMGLLFLSGYVVATYFLKDDDFFNIVVPEVLSIVSWVFVWAATERFFFESRSLKRELKKYQRLHDAKIHFIVEK